MHSVCFCSLPVWKRSFLKKGTPMHFLPRSGSAIGRVWPTNNNTCKGHLVIHAYKVSSNQLSGSGEEVENINCLTDDGRTDDRRWTTDDGHRVITKGNWSLQLVCPKVKQIQNYHLLQRLTMFSEHFSN